MILITTPTSYLENKVNLFSNIVELLSNVHWNDSLLSGIKEVIGFCQYREVYATKVERRRNRFAQNTLTKKYKLTIGLSECKKSLLFKEITIFCMMCS